MNAVEVKMSIFMEDFSTCELFSVGLTCNQSTLIFTFKSYIMAVECIMLPNDTYFQCSAKLCLHPMLLSLFIYISTMRLRQTGSLFQLSVP